MLSVPLLLNLWLASAILFFSVCYVIGGQWRKWVRRYLGSNFLGSSIIAIFLIKHGVSWWLIPVVIGGAWYCPSLILFSYSVNNDRFWTKVSQRGVYGLSLGLAGFAVSLSTGAWGWGIAQVILAVAGNIYFGAVNPFGSRWGNFSTLATDFCIALSSTVFLVPILL